MEKEFEETEKLTEGMSENQLMNAFEGIKEKEFKTLSEKIIYRGGILYPAELFKLSDIKEFIKIITDEICQVPIDEKNLRKVHDIINKRAGPKLTK